MTGNPVPNGAFYLTTATGNTEGSGSVAMTPRCVAMDASRSSAIYGTSDTVQPAALLLLPQIKI